MKKKKALLLFSEAVSWKIRCFSQKKSSSRLIQAHPGSSRLIQADPGSSRLIQAQFCLSNGKNWFPFNRMTWFIVMISQSSRKATAVSYCTPTLSLTRAPVLGLWKLGVFSETSIIRPNLKFSIVFILIHWFLFSRGEREYRMWEKVRN